MALEEIGLKYVTQGVEQFQASLNTGAKLMAGFQKAAESAGKVVSSFGKVLGNVAQIALGILTRDVLRGIVRGVGTLFKEAAEGIFGSAEALEKLQDGAAKAQASLPDLTQDLGEARLKLAEMTREGKASAVEFAEQAHKIKGLEQALQDAGTTIHQAAVATNEYNNSLAGQVDAWRKQLVGVAQGLIEKYLPTLTSAFQKLTPLATYWIQELANFLSRPEFIAAANRIVDWLSVQLPVALNNLRKAFQPVLDILFGSGSWQEKFSQLTGLFVDWAEGLWRAVEPNLDQWAERFFNWIVSTSPLLSGKLFDEWVPAFWSWLTDPATLTYAGNALGRLGAWLLEQGLKLTADLAIAIGKQFLTLFDLVVNGAGTGGAADIVSTFLGAFWKAFSQSYVFRQIRDQLRIYWLTLQSEIGNAWYRIYQVIDGVWTQIGSAVENAWLRISDGLRNGWIRLRDTATDKWNRIKDAVESAWEAVHFAVLSAYYDLENKLKLAWSLFKGDVRDTWENIKNAIVGPIQTAIDTVKGIITDPRKRQEFIDGAVKWVQGMISGLGSMAQSLYNKAVELANKAVQGMKNALGIHSPSAVGFALGVNFGEGFGMGMRSALQGAVFEATASVAPAAAGGSAAASYSYSSTSTYSPSLTINSPAPANVGMSFAMLNALASNPTQG